MNKKIGPIFLIPILLFISCTQKKSTKDEEPLARVYDQYLYPSELENLLSENSSSEDSTTIVSEYIDNWIRHNLILRIAENNLQSRLPQIEKQTREYRESLIIYAYEKQWLTENLDTIVSEDSLHIYYEKFPEQFILQEDIFQLSYAKVSKELSGYDSLRRWFASDMNRFRNELEVFCLNNCDEFYFEAEKWFGEEMLFSLFPIQLFENGKLKTQKLAEHADETFKYIVKVDAFYTKGAKAPFTFVKNNIRQIIIGKRKMEILKNNYQNMYQEAFKQEDTEIYSVKK